MAFCVATQLRAEGAPNWKELGREGAQVLSEYLRVDTSNPPGNEARAVAFLSRILRREGIPFQVFRSARNRSNLYARLQGAGGGRPLVLLHHVDVVPASREFWSVDPFGGIIRDGYVYGRGALDCKGLGIAHLMAFLALKRLGVPLARDVIFLATAEEESGGALGAGWMLDNGPALLRQSEVVLTEGGNNIVRNGKLVYVGIETTQKTPLWLRVTATGPPGHGSIPLPNSAVTRLVRAVNRITNMDSPIRVVPPVEEYFKNIAPLQTAELRERFADIGAAARDSAFVNALSPALRALLRNTATLTVLEGGNKTNVIPPQAHAELDCRLLPGEDPDRFLSRLKETALDPTLDWTVLLKFNAAATSMRSDLVDGIRQVTHSLDPDAVVGNAVLTGFTDSHYFRELGIAAYGFSPFKIDEEDAAGVHGNDERLSLENIEFGVRFVYEVVSRFARTTERSTEPRTTEPRTK